MPSPSKPTDTNSAMKAPLKKTKAEGACRAVPRWARWGLSLLFLLHLAAIFVAPLGFSIEAAYSIAPQKAPQVDEGERPPRFWLHETLGPYLDALYLNHGYGFFGPDPGASHLIRYRIRLADGSVVTGTFPDVEEHWPRLRYHRHFMLAEQAALLPYGPEGYAHYLLRKYDAEEVTLENIEHRLARPEDVLQGVELDDPRLYEVVGSVTVRRGDVPSWETEGEGEQGRPQAEEAREP